jgi:hypothetical protein
MNIPLDNLYHWIQGLAQHPVMLYVFRPHGSKDIFNLTELEDVSSITYGEPLATGIICHDQEPLDFSAREFNHDLTQLEDLFRKRDTSDDALFLMMLFYSNLDRFPNFKPNWLDAGRFRDWSILLHSEKNSKDVEQFAQQGFLPVYYWSHAVISRDWYRFALRDVRLTSRQIEKTFLVYCRDWTPNREYRLKFLELLVSSRLSEDCVVSTQHTNNQGVHITDYQPQDSRFVADAQSLLCIPDNNSLPSASADYDVSDITSTAVSIVLETVADGDKIHLTEKTLRPIACAHPFILMAGPGSLTYLKSYGFQTFSDFWNEDYDQEIDTLKRMEMITRSMTQIQQLSDSDWININKIAEYNKQHFFSEKFIKQIVDELQTNLNHAVSFCSQHRGETYWSWRKFIRQSGIHNQYAFFKSEISKNTVRELRKHRSTRFRNVSTPVIGQ